MCFYVHRLGPWIAVFPAQETMLYCIAVVNNNAMSGYGREENDSGCGDVMMSNNMRVRTVVYVDESVVVLAADDGILHRLRLDVVVVFCPVHHGVGLYVGGMVVPFSSVPLLLVCGVLCDCFRHGREGEGGERYVVGGEGDLRGASENV